MNPTSRAAKRITTEVLDGEPRWEDGAVKPFWGRHFILIRQIIEEEMGRENIKPTSESDLENHPYIKYGNKGLRTR